MACRAVSRRDWIRMKNEPQCPCMSGEARYTQFREWRSLPTDTTDGRYADVDVSECVECGRLWLSYFVEYEAFTKSGRWARGLIAPDIARTIQSEQAPDYLANLPSYIRGGSYFDGRSGAFSGPIKWGI